MILPLKKNEKQKERAFEIQENLFMHLHRISTRGNAAREKSESLENRKGNLEK